MSVLLDVRDLSVTYRDGDRTVRAVDGVNLCVAAGETLALVGESGCGKTTVALGILRLVPSPAGRVTDGRVLFEGRDLLAMPADELRRIRGQAISVIFQDPLAGLNPVLTVGQQVSEIIEAHVDLPRREARRMTHEALRDLGFADAERIARQYPFQLSGGMAQRVMIAIATVLRPRLIIADEPTSSVDVTIQLAILEELDRLRRGAGSAILLITHDLGVVAQRADRVAVMYAGRIVETCGVRELYRQPRHPYTWSLLSALPRLDGVARPLPQIRGQPPDLTELTGECAFLPRCPKAVLTCRSEPWPPLADVAPGHAVACYNPMAETVEALANQ